MKGKLTKTEKGWVVKYKKSYTLDAEEAQYEGKSIAFYDEELLLHPDDVRQIEKDNLVFDNLEARIAAHPIIDFEIIREDFGCSESPFCEGDETCIQCSTDYAKIVPITPVVSDDFQIGPDGAYEYEEPLYTEEQVRKAYFQGAADVHDKCTKRTWKGVETSVDIELLKKLNAEYIESLKQYKS